MTRDPYWIKDFYTNLSLTKNISFSYDILNERWVLEMLGTILEFCDCELTKKDNKFYIKQVVKTKPRIHYWGLYQYGILYCSTCIYYPKVDCGILLNNRRKEVHILNIHKFNAGRLLYRFLQDKKIFKDTSDKHYTFSKTKKTIEITT